MSTTKNSRTIRFSLALLALTLGSGVARAEMFDVKCDDGMTIGKMNFDTYKDDSNDDVASVLIQGGFDPNGACKLAPGFSYRWLQTVTSSRPIYAWQNADQTYMDRSRKAPPDDKIVADSSPFYKFFRGPGNGHTLGFEDNPARVKPFTDGYATWELTLVCAQAPPDESDPNNKREIMAIASFEWGFTTDKDGKVTLNPIQMLDHPSDSLFAAFQDDPDTKTFKDSWNLGSGCCCTPEPSSLVMSVLLIGLIGGAQANRFVRLRRAA